jgi:hypothetical protein
MKRFIVTALAVLCLSAPILAQNQAALAIVGQLDVEAARAKPGATRNALRELLADLRVLLEEPVPPCPVCPDPVVCPLPDVCPTCPAPVVCPVIEEPPPPPPPIEEPPPIVVPPSTTVSTAAELHAALRTPGVYTLAPGTYVGNFVAAVDGVTIIGAALPDARVTPDATAGYKLIPQDPGGATLRISASHIRVTGVWIGQGKPGRTVVEIGSADVADPLLQPDDVTLDRVEIVAGELGGLRGIAAHTRAFTLTRSRVVNFWWQNQESQAFLACNGPGPYTITDNHLQASGENVMWGGGSIRSAAMVPGNVLLKGNLIDKPMEWRRILNAEGTVLQAGHPGSVKNSIEFKAVRGAVVDGNLIDGMWPDAQPGAAIVLTPRNQYNDSPWTVVEDVVIRGNKLTNHVGGYWISILGTDNNAPSLQTSRITIEGNYTDSLRGIQVGRGVAGWLRVSNNTMPRITAAVLSFEGNQVLTPLTFTKNVVRAGSYGIQGQNATGIAGLDYYCAPGWVVQGNVIEQPVRTIWPWTAPNTNTFVVAPNTLAPLLDAEGHYTPGGAGW